MGKETPRKRSKEFQRIDIKALLQVVATRNMNCLELEERGAAKKER